MTTAAALDTIVQDARYAFRALRRTPGFTAVCTLSTMLGIGTATAVFTLVGVLLLTPPPYPAADRLVVPFQTAQKRPAAPVDTVPWTVARYEHLRRTVQAFESVGFSTWEDMNVRASAAAESPERMRVEIVSASLLATLRVRPQLGRLFFADEDRPGVAHSVALVSHRMWQRQWGGGPMSGVTIDLDGEPVSVVGVMPPGFTGLVGGADLWIPLHVMPRIKRGPGWVERLDRQEGTVVARLHHGASLASARAQLAAVGPEMNTLLPDRFGPATAGPGAVTPAERGTGAMALAEARRHPLVTSMLLVLGVAVAALMLIVCANVASLLLARAHARRTEIGVRLALGASRWRIARQALTESLVLAALGVVPGVAVAYWGAAALARLRPQLPRTDVLLRGTDLLAEASLVPDWRVLGFALALGLVAGLLFGAAPAITAARVSAADLLTGGSDARAGGRGRRLLVVGQVALATTLLVGAGLMVRSLTHLLEEKLGFEADGVVVASLTSVDTSAAARVRRATLLDRVRAIPGVESAATHDCIAFNRDCIFTMPIVPTGADAGVDAPEGEVHVISPEYLDVVRIPLIAGRGFDRTRTGSPAAARVLLSESAARRLWGDARLAVGRRVDVWGPGAPGAEVVGVVGDVKFDAIERPPMPAMYLRRDEMGDGSTFRTVLYVRTRLGPAAASVAIRRALADADPTLAVHGEATLQSVVRAAASSVRFVALLLVAFALTAAFLATIGVYGVLTYLVSQRTREFGIRMAIGAQRRSLVGQIVRQGAALTATGIALGLVGALGASGLLVRFLYGVTRSDGATYAAIVALLGTAGCVAALIPALRATRVDPAMTLRQ